MCAFKYVWGRNQWAHKIIRTLIFSFQIHFYKRETKNHVIRFFEELLNLAEVKMKMVNAAGVTILCKIE